MAQTEAMIDHKRLDIAVYEHDKKRVTIIKFNIPMFQNMMRQRELMINRYTVNSVSQFDKISLPNAPGLNLAEKLKKQTHYEVKFVLVVVGAAGEYFKDVAEERS